MHHVNIRLEEAIRPGHDNVLSKSWQTINPISPERYHSAKRTGKTKFQLLKDVLSPDPDGVETSISSKSISQASISAHLFRGATAVFGCESTFRCPVESASSLSLSTSLKRGLILLDRFSLSASSPPAWALRDPPYRFLDTAPDTDVDPGFRVPTCALLVRVVLVAMDESCEGDLVSQFLRDDVEGERTGVEVAVVMMKFLVLCFNLAVGLAVPFCFPAAVSLPDLGFPGVSLVVLLASLPLMARLPLFVGKKLESSSASLSSESESAGISNSVVLA